VQGAVRDGMALADVRDVVREAGERPDAATLSHLYSRAVEGGSRRDHEGGYRDSVDRDLYLNRRPGAGNIARMPEGFGMAGKYRQVVQVTGLDPVTGKPASVYVNVQFDRLLTRGEAIDLGIAAVQGGSPTQLLGALEADYVATWAAA
jgi:hypothetical protein